MSKLNYEKFESVTKYKVVYIFEIDDDAHKGLVKIGDCTIDTDKKPEELHPSCHDLNKAAKERINSYTSTAAIEYTLLYTELAIRKVNKEGEEVVESFRDYKVHDVLINSNYKKKRIGNTKGNEWFKVDLNTAKQAICAVKKGKKNLSGEMQVGYSPIIFRDEQAAAIKETIKRFKKSNQYLWNAKMRFGKTLSALEVVKRSKYSKTIIVTHRPVVDEGWYEDFNKIFYDSKDYFYGSNKRYPLTKLLALKKNFVYFASMQDLRGSKAVGGKYEKNKEVFDTEWDLVIVDEAHEGTQTKLGDNVIKAIVKEDNNTKFLALTGTPFNIISDYSEEDVYTWDYIMEQEMKSEWDKEHFGDSNPYASLPEMCIYTYDLGKLLKGGNYITCEDKAFNFAEFFRTWTGDPSIDYKVMPADTKVGDFVHEDDVKSLLNLLTKSDKDNNYPFASQYNRSLFQHTFWVLPGVAQAKAFSKLLKEHDIFGNGAFDIINVAGDGDEEDPTGEALQSVKDGIAKARKSGKYTITLSCGKLTTGVTVPEWSAVFILAGSYSTSASSYLQTIFRVQSPCDMDGKVKERCYVFDFAPDRTLKMVSDAVSISAKAGKTNETDRQILGKFLNFCPVISIAGSQMKLMNTYSLLQQLKRAYAERVVRHGFEHANLYNEELLKLDDLDIEKFNELQQIVGSSNAVKNVDDIPVNEQGLTDEERERIEAAKKKKKKDRTPEEIEALRKLEEQKNQRKKAINILNQISRRMPLMIYGADIPYSDDITLDDFVKLVDDSSWEEFMPQGVTKEKFNEFKKYYDEDVFIQAGRHIRNQAKHADILDPTERTKRIALLFSQFKNPDKETVLTPWRVVNLHMSSALGGWCFWDENFEYEIDKPRFVNRGDITEKTFKNSKSKILEINSKTGLYPLYVTYSLLRNSYSDQEFEDASVDDLKATWFDVIKDNVFIICKTPMAKSITQRTLAGYSGKKINSHYFVDLVNTMEHKQGQFIDTVLKPSYWKKGEKTMDFTAVIGNPPYQKEGQNIRKPPVYHLFYDAAFNISEIVSLITPGRFLFNAGQTPKNWNKKMLEDNHFKITRYSTNSKELFPDVEIKGGVAISLRNECADYGAIGTFTEHKNLNSILTKVSDKNKNSISSIIVRGVPYGFSEKLKSDYPEYLDSIEKSFDLRTNVFNKLYNKLFFNEKKSDNFVKIYGIYKKSRACMWIDKTYLKVPKNFSHFKLLIPEASGAGRFGETLSKMIVANPYEGHTQSFHSFGDYTSRDEVTHLKKYIQTKFARCMLSVLKTTQHITAYKWKYVPMQDFTNESDIDWSKSVPEIDKQLYKKYGLNEEEIDFIEKNVQPME